MLWWYKQTELYPKMFFATKFLLIAPQFIYHLNVLSRFVNTQYLIELNRSFSELENLI